LNTTPDTYFIFLNSEEKNMFYFIPSLGQRQMQTSVRTIYLSSSSVIFLRRRKNEEGARAWQSSLV